MSAALFSATYREARQRFLAAALVEGEAVGADTALQHGDLARRVLAQLVGEVPPLLQHPSLHFRLSERHPRQPSASVSSGAQAMIRTRAAFLADPALGALLLVRAIFTGRPTVAAGNALRSSLRVLRTLTNVVSFGSPLLLSDL